MILIPVLTPYYDKRHISRPVIFPMWLKVIHEYTRCQTTIIIYKVLKPVSPSLLVPWVGTPSTAHTYLLMRLKVFIAPIYKTKIFIVLATNVFQRQAVISLQRTPKLNVFFEKQEIGGSHDIIQLAVCTQSASTQNSITETIMKPMTNTSLSWRYTV